MIAALEGDDLVSLLDALPQARASNPGKAMESASIIPWLVLPLVGVVSYYSY